MFLKEHKLYIRVLLKNCTIMRVSNQFISIWKICTDEKCMLLGVDSITSTTLCIYKFYVGLYKHIYKINMK